MLTMRLRHPVVLFRTLTICIASFAALPSTAHAQGVAERLDSALKVAEGKGFSGVVRVDQAGRTLLERGYGLANRSTATRFTPATVVQIGSNTKDFTAVAILQLVEQGKLALSDSIGRFFANVPADKRGITVQQLMNHRAGFPIGIGGDFDVLTRQALVDSAMRTRLLFAPGTRESYSNTGFSLLAAIIEQLTGSTYDEYVQRAILAPARLHRTGFLLPGFAEADLAHGYLPAGTDAGTMLAKPHASDGPWWNLRGNGGMLSTADDMMAFYHALLDEGKLLKPATLALRFDPNEPIGLAGSDGVNFFLYDRLPMLKTEMIIATTNAAVKGPEIRRIVGQVMGLPSPDGGEEEIARRPGGHAVPADVGDVLTRLIATLNVGTPEALRPFIATNFASGDGEPTVDARVERLARAHETLGALRITRMEAFDDGTVDMEVDSSVQRRVLLRVMIDAGSPHRIHGVQVRLGG